MIKKFLSLLLVFATLFTCSVGIHATDIIVENPQEVLYTPSELAIFEKINKLGKAKAVVLQYKNEHNLSDDNGDRVYLALLDEANSIRNELIAMGAKPSSEELESLRFTPVEINGDLIDDFADFEETYGGVYDLWGGFSYC